MNTSPRQRTRQRPGRLGPYFALALVLPGGALLAPLIWFFQRKHGKA